MAGGIWADGVLGPFWAADRGPRYDTGRDFFGTVAADAFLVSHGGDIKTRLRGAVCFGRKEKLHWSVLEQGLFSSGTGSGSCFLVWLLVLWACRRAPDGQELLASGRKTRAFNDST